jgi:phenylpropionate dioxygenase-like ring-hydroxylating dioxygenase large terminal subunit
LNDPVLLNDWHPAASMRELTPGKLVATTVLGQELVLWRAADGRVRAWENRCPHRGTRLSIGRIDGDRVVCAYHGWQFAADGHCKRVPALPDFQPPQPASVKAFPALEKYGLIWVCLGERPEGPPSFPEAEDAALRPVVCGPYEVAASAPRIVENFLDMAHFAYVHPGILGDHGRPEVRDYEVRPLEGEGVIATGCFAWQPQTNSLAQGGSEVEYSYRVVRPLTAILTKIPEVQQDYREAISLHVQPVEEELSRAWVVMAMTNFVQPEDELRGFQDRIFLQDKPILENQVPRKLPLGWGAEIPVRSDRLAQAYRRYLRDKGLRYGVIA